MSTMMTGPTGVRMPKVAARDTPAGAEALRRMEGLAGTADTTTRMSMTFWAQMCYEMLVDVAVDQGWDDPPGGFGTPAWSDGDPKERARGLLESMDRDREWTPEQSREAAGLLRLALGWMSLQDDAPLAAEDFSGLTRRGETG